MSAKKHCMQAYLGVNSSLYSRLDTRSIEHIENASRLTDYGRYAEAQQIYDNDLLSQRLFPAVVLGKAELALKQYKMGVLYRLLDEALLYASEQRWDLDEAQFRLMALTRAFAAFSHNGICEPAVTEIARAQIWLRDVNVADYTDIQVERTRLPPMERLDAVIEVQAYIRDNYELSKERTAWVDADLAIYAAQSLYEMREGEKGALALIKADGILDQWCSIARIAQKNDLTLELDSKLTRLRFTDFEDDPTQYYKESTELFEVMKRNYHTSTTVCYGHVIEAARRLMTSSDTDPYRATFYRLLHELHDYQEGVLEDIRGLLFDRAPLFTEASSNTRDAIKVLEWLDGFEKKNPAFDIPNGLEFISTRRRLIYLHRRHSEKQAEEEAKMEKLKDKVPGRVGVLVAVRKPKAVIVPASGGSPKAEIAFPLDVDEDNFFMAWVNVAGKSKETRAQAMQYLIKWMIFDLRAGVIHASEISTLLGMAFGFEESSKICTQLEVLSPEVAFSKLYLHRDKSGVKVLDAKEWPVKFEILRLWLGRFSKPTLNGRQYLWVVLQVIRKDSMIEFKAPIMERVMEIERCISIIETLRPKVKEVVSPNKMLWKGSIASQYFLSCIESEEFNSEIVGQRLASAVDIGMEVLNGFELLGDVLQTASWQRSTGEICLFKLYWMLLQPDQTLSDPELVKLQQIGLHHLQHADGFFAPLLQDVTWSRGLESVQERERSISTTSSWRIPQMAVRLLAAGGLPADDSNREAIWSWVQKSKARALSMAMGTAGKVPTALLQQIMAIEKYRVPYDKFLYLQQQIQTAEPQQRFQLRQEMDKHLKEMRKYRPLAEMCDIKDGKALTLTDLDTISAVSKSPIVLVDWFYVSLDAYDEGSILLLTAKPGGTPTIDNLPIKPPEIAAWIESNLDSDFSQYIIKDASGLNPLVQALVNLTNPNDTLILSTSSHLNRIPLHAIDINDNDNWQPLIHRNPIVYTHSHSLLRTCLYKAQEAATTHSPLHSLFINGIPNTPANAAYAAGRASARTLAHTYKSTPYLDSSGTKANFLAHAPSSRLIHIHSHVEWTTAEPLAHSICFAPPGPDTTSSIMGKVPGADADAEVETKLSAREIFALSFPRGSHVSLIACSGGLVRVSPEEEVMGLVPALLHAGASSTVSTLWPIEDGAGAGFADTFYRRLNLAMEGEEDGAEGGTWVDLARVFRDAVVERDQVEAAGGRLHWMAFVLHGFWQIWVPGEREVV